MLYFRMPTPRDPELYDKIKKQITSKYKPSAYRSALITREYKKEYENKHKNNNAYIGKKDKNKGLIKWMREQWRSDTGNIGYTSKSSVYRPTIRINEKTPITFSELSKQQIEKAKKEKAKTGRVKNFAKL